MKKSINKLEALLITTKDYVSSASERTLSHKSHPEKWSKKEVIGHLIDSGINNIRRFMSVMIQKEVYRVRPMKQVELVAANDYQHAEIGELIALLVALNNRIIHLMALQTSETLATKIELYTEGNMSDLKYLMEDYVTHFEGHIMDLVKRVADKDC